VVVAFYGGALGGMAVMRALCKLVSDVVPVVGFDDIPLAAYFDPPLTTIRLPAHDLGRAAGVALLDHINGRAVETRTVLPTTLVIRSSTGPPASAGRWSRDVPGRAAAGGGQEP
jgi:DNA-binding LacI/PurR family transcriptional regulator